MICGYNAISNNGINMKKNETGRDIGTYCPPDIEIKVKGEAFLTYHKGNLSMVAGEEALDMSQLCKLIGVLSDALAMGIASQTLAAKDAAHRASQQAPALSVADYDVMHNVFPIRRPVKN